MRLLVLVLIAGSLTGLSACKSPRKGALSPEEKNRLVVLADAQSEPEEKFHGLGQNIATLLQEALAMDSDSAMLAHLGAFSEENEDALSRLSEEIDDWLKTLSDDEQLLFLMRLSAMDYARKLSQYDSRFRRRANGRVEYLQPYEKMMKNLEMRK